MLFLWHGYNFKGIKCISLPILILVSVTQRAALAQELAQAPKHCSWGTQGLMFLSKGWIKNTENGH